MRLKVMNIFVIICSVLLFLPAAKAFETHFLSLLGNFSSGRNAKNSEFENSRTFAASDAFSNLENVKRMNVDNPFQNFQNYEAGTLTVTIAIATDGWEKVHITGKNIIFWEMARKIEESNTASNITYLEEEGMETAKIIDKTITTRSTTGNSKITSPFNS